MNTLVLVLTGNPGVGKHTVSKILAEILGYKIVDINITGVVITQSKYLLLAIVFLLILWNEKDKYK